MNSRTIELRQGVDLKTYIWDSSEELRIKKRPAVLVFPGGGYLMCSDREAEPIALSYAAEGYNTFVLRYTVRTGFKRPFEEAQEALKLIRAHADDWNVLPDKIAVCGFSAGGHLAAAMGIMAEVKPNAMILGYPAVLAEDWEKANMNMPDLVGKVDKDTVPAFIFSTFEDSVVPVQNSILLIDRLNRHKVPFECHIFQTGQHGLSLAKTHTASGDPVMVNDSVDKWFGMSVAWLKKTFGAIEGIQMELDPDLSPVLSLKIKEIAENTALTKVLSKYIDGIDKKDFQEMAGEAPFYTLFRFVTLSENEFDAMIRESEITLNIKKD